MSETLPDLKKVIERVRKIAAVNPDFVYEYNPLHGGCDYVRDEKPSCLLGQAFYAEGVSVEELKVWDDTGSFENVVRELLEPENYSPEDVSWLQSVQGSQDSAKPWEEAIVNADYELKVRSYK